MMRILRTLFLLAAVMGCCTSVLAKPMLKASFESRTYYYGIGAAGGGQTMVLYITVTTLEGVYYGTWTVEGRVNSYLPLRSWSGPGPAPQVQIAAYDNTVDRSHCPGLGAKWDSCGSMQMKVSLQNDDYGCPWVSSGHIESTELAVVSNPIKKYTAPNVRDSVCAKFPVDSFDISWDPNTPTHETVLRMEATGETVNATLHTYLMQNNKLCDGSKLDERGAYCRVVNTGITLSVLGCDQNSVTSTAVPHPITDIELHDINVSVNTRNMGSGSFSSTCSFQYIIDQL